MALLAQELPSVPLIVDPVLVSKHGHRLADDQVATAYRESLFPKAWMITPNRFELEAITGCRADDPTSWEPAIDRIHGAGTKHVLVKMGDLEGRRRHLLSLEGRRVWLEQPDVHPASNHGAGCVLSAAITSLVALAMATGETCDAERIARQAIQATHQAVTFRNGLGGGISPAETRVI
jgi:hydroxymethylpyrimidine/phosphomethylpyrimidine kinase